MTEVKRVYCPNCNRIMRKWEVGDVGPERRLTLYNRREVYHCETCEPEYRMETPYQLRQLFDEADGKKHEKISDIDDSEREYGK